jgi:hypothetical protein
MIHGCASPRSCMPALCSAPALVPPLPIHPQFRKAVRGGAAGLHRRARRTDRLDADALSGASPPSINPRVSLLGRSVRTGQAATLARWPRARAIGARTVVKARSTGHGGLTGRISSPNSGTITASWRSFGIPLASSSPMFARAEMVSKKSAMWPTDPRVNTGSKRRPEKAERVAAPIGHESAPLRGTTEQPQTPAGAVRKKFALLGALAVARPRCSTKGDCPRRMRSSVPSVCQTDGGPTGSTSATSRWSS